MSKEPTMAIRASMPEEPQNASHTSLSLGLIKQEFVQSEESNKDKMYNKFREARDD
jgi:hypothetical protein